MPKGYVSARAYRGVLIFAASASFLCGMALFLTGHQLGGTVAFLSSIGFGVLLFFSIVGANNRAIDEEQEDAERERAKRKKAEKPKQPPNYKDLN